RLLTPLGTPVVAGAGISDGFIGITSSPVAYRGAVEDLSGRDYDLLDRGQNDLLAIAERAYTVGFEDCGLMYMQIDMPVLTVTPPTPPAE
ncbi:MAG TPA: hypothetical protein VN108_03920, partial [Marmoricola sp.]|nr:hypothetical protein [Marmoricola sp.]